MTTTLSNIHATCAHQQAYGDFRYPRPSHVVDYYQNQNNGDISGLVQMPTLEPDYGSDIAFEVMVLTLDMGYPVGVECMECEGTFEEGDIVLAGQKRMVGWIGWHTRCLKGILEESPLDDFETTKQKLLNGEDPFE